MDENKNTVYFQPDTVIFREGDDADKLYLIKSGEVLCLKSSRDRLTPIFLAKEQDIIGESAMLSGAPQTYSTIAKTRVEAIVIPSSTFRDVMNAAPQWLADLTLTMVARYQNTASLISENRVMSASIISEEDFSPALEIEYKKILSQ